MKNVIIFVDIRGFSKWSEGNEAFEFVKQFVTDFYEMLHKYFPNTDLIKTLGDGAMIVEEIRGEPEVQELLKTSLDRISLVEKDFSGLCIDFAHRHGYKTGLHLGWGIVRGIARKLNGDYIGGNINKAARLCSIARPFGIVVEKDDFPELGGNLPFDFIDQVRNLEGISEPVDVWVTKKIATQFITREKIRHTPEVHVAGMCVKYDETPQILIAKRKPDRQLYPNFYEGCGGQLARSESFADGVKRHFKLELKIDVDVVSDVHNFYLISEPNEPLIQGVRFLCLYKRGEPRSQNHSELVWVTVEEFKRIDDKEFIPGLKDEFISLLEKHKGK